MVGNLVTVLVWNLVTVLVGDLVAFLAGYLLGNLLASLLGNLSASRSLGSSISVGSIVAWWLIIITDGFGMVLTFLLVHSVVHWLALLSVSVFALLSV